MRNLVLKKRDEVNQPTLLQVAGSRLGCLDCNRWSWEGSKHLFTEPAGGGFTSSERKNDSEMSGPIPVRHQT
jgi:hypothetical protein